MNVSDPYKVLMTLISRMTDCESVVAKYFKPALDDGVESLFFLSRLLEIGDMAKT